MTLQKNIKLKDTSILWSKSGNIQENLTHLWIYTPCLIKSLLNDEVSTSSSTPLKVFRPTHECTWTHMHNCSCHCWKKCKSSSGITSRCHVMLKIIPSILSNRLSSIVSLNLGTTTKERSNTQANCYSFPIPKHSAVVCSFTKLFVKLCI